MKFLHSSSASGLLLLVVLFADFVFVTAAFTGEKTRLTINEGALRSRGNARVFHPLERNRMGIPSVLFQRLATEHFSLPSPTSLFVKAEYRNLHATNNNDSEEVRKDAVWARGLQSLLLLSIPIAAMVASFNFYPMMMSSFNEAFEIISGRTWSPVDGGTLQATIVSPAINGIVMPVISLLFASQVSTVGSTLRQRQLTVHTCLNKETEEIRGFFYLIDLFPPGPRERIRSYLQRYVSHLSAESAPDVDWSSLCPKNDALLAVLNELHEISANKRSGDNAAAVDVSVVSPVILSQSYSATNRIMTERAARITALQTFFPPLQFAIMAILSVFICVVFLIETDQNLMLFLGSFQLKVIWSMLIGMITAVFCVVYDLANPFAGTYQIPQIIDDDLIPWNTDPRRDESF